MESEAGLRQTIDGLTNDLRAVVTELVNLRQIERSFTFEESTRFIYLDQKKSSLITLRRYFRLKMYQLLLSPDADDAEKNRLVRYCGLAP